MSTADLTQQKVITVRDLETLAGQGIGEIRVREDVVLTPSARDLIRELGLTVVTAGGASAAGVPTGVGASSAGVSAPVSVSAAIDAAFHSPEALAIKKEVCAVGRKLWEREYVDGNGGNISCRLNDEYVICTPTLLSKGDLTPEDLCMVDMNGNQVAGVRARSSEILLHTEIMKAVPQARAVLHCHPPHATAYAITGLVPPPCIIPEAEVFVGRIALAPYETPGTQRFAETVLPYVKDHNTILLANHGIVTWADTVTHAEWFAEVVDSYCRILILASHLGAPPVRIPTRKEADLIEIKKKLGLADARFGLQECQLCDGPDFPGGITACPPSPRQGQAPTVSDEEVERVVQAVTDQVMAVLSKKE